MKLCSSFMAVATCLSVFALHIRPVASTCQSCQVDLDCNFDNNTTDVPIDTTDVTIEFTICDPDAQFCVTLNSLRDIDCRCSNGEDCQSGRCEGLFGATCQAKLEDGQGCNEDSDCVSGDCNFRFICVSVRVQEPTSAPISQPQTPSPIDDTNGNEDDDLSAGSIAAVIIVAVVMVLLVVCCILCPTNTRCGECCANCDKCYRNLCQCFCYLCDAS
jgi:hypothetical protein